MNQPCKYIVIELEDRVDTISKEDMVIKNIDGKTHVSLDGQRTWGAIDSKHRVIGDKVEGLIAAILKAGSR